uniref:Transposase (Putative), gypsy type n=1 Tax=Tanacetum cinerariifolium TaxID=118510 RepID=A0A6L2M3D8_TANCI|nr:hypothetical protein [Tanacetum cinerariifolium]
MDLFAFIRHCDPTRVRVGERETANREVKLLTLTEGRTISLDPPASAASGGSGDSIDKLKVVGDASGSTFSPKKRMEDYHAATSNIRGTSLATIRGLVPDGSSVSSGVTKPHAVVFVTPMPDDGPTNSVYRLNLLTCPPSLRSPAADVPITTVAFTATVIADASAVPPPKDLDSKTLHRIYVPKWNVTNDSVLDDPYVCRDLTDRLALPVLYLQLRAIDSDQLYNKFNVRAARQVKAKEATRLHGQLSAIEAVDAAKSNELRDLKERKCMLEGEKDVLFEKVKTLKSAAALKETELAPLTSKVASLKSERDSLVDHRSSLGSAFDLFMEHMKAMQDKQAKVLGSRVAELDAQLLEMDVHLEEEFCPCFLTTISGRRWILTHGLKLVLLKCLQSPEYLQALGQANGWTINKGIQGGLKAGIDYEKAGRDLSVIEAYDPFMEAKYVDVVSALRTMDFSLLSVLKSKKDSSIVDLMDSLRLEGPLAEIHRDEGQ